MQNLKKVRNFMQNYSKVFVEPIYINLHHEPFVPGINMTYYEIDLYNGFVYNVQGMEYLGLVSRKFDLPISLNMAHPQLQHLLIDIKIHAYLLLKEAAEKGELVVEDFLKSIFIIRFPVRYYRIEDSIHYLSATQRLRIVKYDESFNIRVKSVTTVIDEMTPVNTADAFELAKEVDFAFYNTNGRPVASLNNRLRKRVFSPFLPDPFLAGRPGELAACYADLGYNATHGDIAAAMNISKEAVRKHLEKIRQEARLVIEQILPGASMGWKEKKKYLFTLESLGIL